MRSSDTAILHFEDVRVPADHIIGDEGMGFTYQMIQVRLALRSVFVKSEICLETTFIVKEQMYR
jgi:alkylation response protein AidB-like acyl-CoA dehydrogenase